jgi:hypothetical protein
VSAKYGSGIVRREPELNGELRKVHPEPAERRILMTKTIKWEKDFDRVLTLARAENKMVLLDFFNPL